MQCSDAELREKRKSLDSGNTRKEQNLEVIELLLEAHRRKISLESPDMHETEKEQEERK